MLCHLWIHNFLLAKQLNLVFKPGLCVLSGETGAGKSIILDAIAIALGQRSDSRFVRQGCDQATVSLSFDLDNQHPLWQKLEEAGVITEPGQALTLKRILSQDGRSRGFINDQPVSVTLLKKAADYLIDIEGQFSHHNLLNPSVHRHFLDEFGDYPDLLHNVRSAYHTWQEAKTQLDHFLTSLSQHQEKRQILEENLHFLAKLAPKKDEQPSLDQNRQRLMHKEQLVQGVTSALNCLTGPQPLEKNLNQALRHLERLTTIDPNLAAASEFLTQANLLCQEALLKLQHVGQSLDFDDRQLDKIEERLHNLQRAAQRFGCSVDDLPDLWQQTQAEFDMISDHSAILIQYQESYQKAFDHYKQYAEALWRKRQEMGKKLENHMQTQLAALKLEKARFYCTPEMLPEDQWHEQGCDQVQFSVATNPGIPPAPLHKVASGGELARFLLALKTILTKGSFATTFIFDEVDSGVGGATASAVGQHLLTLSREKQVILITHSPQIAAVADHHWRVSKIQEDQTTETTVTPLTPAERTEEIARMLAGSSVTEAARQAASSLLRTA